MLAKKFDPNNNAMKRNLLRTKLVFQPKLDGIRCCVSFENGCVVLTSRNGKNFKSKSLSRIKDVLFKWYNRECEDENSSSVILDGELYCEGMPFNKIQSIVSNISDDAQDMMIRLYDMCDTSNTDMTYEQRASYCKDVVDYVNGNLNMPIVSFLGYDEAPKHANANEYELARVIEEYHNKYVSEGYEGLIIPTFNGTYQQGKRTNDLIKYKKFVDGEYKISCINDGLGKNVGIPTLTLSLSDDEIVNERNKTFCCVLNGSEEYRREVWNNREKYINKKATVKFFEKSSDNIPRFPICVGIRDYE